MQNTISYNKKRGVGEINQDINLHQPLFTTFTFTDRQVSLIDIKLFLIRNMYVA